MIVWVVYSISTNEVIGVFDSEIKAINARTQYISAIGNQYVFWDKFEVK